MINEAQIAQIIKSGKTGTVGLLLSSEPPRAISGKSKKGSDYSFKTVTHHVFIGGKPGSFDERLDDKTDLASWKAPEPMKEYFFQMTFEQDRASGLYRIGARPLVDESHGSTGKAKTN